MPAHRLRITTRGGTDLQVRLDSVHRWISNRGSSRPGGTIVLPAGEVATYPADVNGTFVADFAFNINTVTHRDARLNRFPVTVKIECGRAVSTECADQSLQQFLDECFSMDHSHNVGELGFGTNTGVAEPIALNSHMNERCPGVHLGFGQHNQDEMQVGYQCQIHLDLIARGGLILVDDRIEPIDLEDLRPSSDLHSMHARDEDVFAPGSHEPDDRDCCGVMRADGICIRTA
jgi:leucyl aminopeptidase (aminopeptidase T)